jgi:hypothetical protein
VNKTFKNTSLEVDNVHEVQQTQNKNHAITWAYIHSNEKQSHLASHLNFEKQMTFKIPTSIIQSIGEVHHGG